MEDWDNIFIYHVQKFSSVPLQSSIDFAYMLNFGHSHQSHEYM